MKAFSEVLMERELVRNFSSSSPSVYTNLPNPNVFALDQLIAEVNGTSYSVKNLTLFLNLLNESIIENGSEIYEKHINEQMLPTVPVRKFNPYNRKTYN